MFQGFTGTMDSLLNDRITLFAVREARTLGLLGKGGYVRTAALIDDAIQAIFMSKDTNFEDAQSLADRQFDITANVWRKLGDELDNVKTMVSDTAFVYLNRFFCEGTEVLTPMKVYAKADREFTRRYATIVEGIDTILGSYRAAVGRGGDPFVCYKMCIYKCIKLMLKTKHVVHDVNANDTILYARSCAIVLDSAAENYIYIICFSVFFIFNINQS